MRGLFKLEDAKIWGGVLIIIGILMLIAVFVLNRAGIARLYPIPPWEIALLVLLFGLGIVFMLVGITVNKVCGSIARMMHTYDNEMHKKIKEWIDKSDQANIVNRE